MAGLAALVLQRFPEFRSDPKKVAKYLKENAAQMKGIGISDYPNNISGHGFAKLPAFRLDWEVSDTSVEAGDSFILTVQMYDALQMGGHGGISVSFPKLNEPGGSNESHSSPVADVEALDYTSGLSSVTFHQRGTTIYHKDNNRQFPAEYLLVESDDASWSSSDTTTLRLRITPRRGEDFPIQIRGWLCADGYTDCERDPSAGNATDQQGHIVELANVSVSEPSAPAPDSQPFKIEWQTSPTEVEAGDSFTLTVRMYDVQQSGEHGGISVSFPSLTQSGGSREGHSSSVADVDALDYTGGLSNVTFHQPGATIYHKDNNRQFPAEYLLVESDDPSWSRSDDRTLRLRVTPKRSENFPIQIRGWLCADGYTDCARNPSAGNATDQQGHVVERTSVVVTGSSASANAAARILFSSDRDGDYDIYVMNADGSDVTRLTDNSASGEIVPRWSPDGRRIAFDSNHDGDWDIYVMNVGRLRHNAPDRQLELG